MHIYHPFINKQKVNLNVQITEAHTHNKHYEHTVRKNYPSFNREGISAANNQSFA